nr:unnamed protein product [Naegleria fowleri]
MGSGLAKTSSQQWSTTNSTWSSETTPSTTNGGRQRLLKKPFEYTVHPQPCEHSPHRLTSVRTSMPTLKAIKKHREHLVTCRTVKQHARLLVQSSQHEKARKVLQKTTSTPIHDDNDDGSGSMRRASSLPETHVVDHMDQISHAHWTEETYQKNYLLAKRSSFLEENEPTEAENCGMKRQESENGSFDSTRTIMVGGVGRHTTFMNSQNSQPNISTSLFSIIGRPTVMPVVECSSSSAAEQSSSHYISQRFDDRNLTPLEEETMMMDINPLSGLAAENSSHRSLSKETSTVSSPRRKQLLDLPQASTFNDQAEMSPDENCIIISNHKSGNSLVRSYSSRSLLKDTPSPVQVIQKDSLPRRGRGEPSSSFHSLQTLYSPSMTNYHSQSALKSLLNPSVDKQMLEKVPLITVTRPEEPPCYSHLPSRSKRNGSSHVPKNRKYLDVVVMM